MALLRLFAWEEKHLVLPEDHRHPRQALNMLPSVTVAKWPYLLINGRVSFSLSRLSFSTLSTGLRFCTEYLCCFLLLLCVQPTVRAVDRQ